MAAESAEPERRDELELVSQSWAVLAESYEFSERIERFLKSRLAVDPWLPISSAPFDRELELAVLEHGNAHAVAFPCRRILNGWINAATKKPIDVFPTHWREWRTSGQP